MENKYAPVSDYDQKMIESYIDKPEVTQWYVNAYKKFNINGIDVMKWHWSWWAFFGGVFYLLYRKAYLAAGILFIAYLVSGFIPFGSLILWILTGGYAPYFTYKSYKEKKLEVEAAIEDETKRFETMRLVGGYNEWAIWIGVVVHLFFWIAVFGIFMMFVTLGLAASS